MPVERLRRPWKICSNEDAYWVEAADGTRFGFCYYSASDIVGTGALKLSRDLARRVVSKIAKIGR